MDAVELPPEAPAWMLALEKKRQRVHRLAHEVGAGSPCLLCEDDCPGLDLHFWRKICRNCKCKKEDHDVIDDCGAEQFEILLGSGHSIHRPNKAFLEMLEKHTSAGLKNKVKNVAFDWVPPNVSPVIAAEYMQSLPASKLPISGSDGALYRRQQLERQLPLHDLDASQCHQLTDAEVENLKKYLENLKNNVVGQGRVTKLHVPGSNSLDSLSKICSFNSVPKPFQSTSGSSTLSSQPPQFAVGGEINTGQGVHLKPPSAFWPKSLSPEPPRSVSPLSSDAPLPSVADRGAAFGVTLSPAKGARPSSRPSGAASGLTGESVLTSPGRLSPSEKKGHYIAHLVKDQTPQSLSNSMNVPGNMWVPTECRDCAKQGVDGQLISDRVCTHLVNSTDLSQILQPSQCAECLMKSANGQLVSDQVCSHVINSTDLPRLLQPSQCTDCVRQIKSGQMASKQVCTHISHSAEVPHMAQPSVCTQCVEVGPNDQRQVCPHVVSSNDSPHKFIPNRFEPAVCAECTVKGLDGRFVRDPLCTHLTQTTESLPKVSPEHASAYEAKRMGTSSEVGAFNPSGELDHYKYSDKNISAPLSMEFRGSSPLPPPGEKNNVPTSLKARPTDGSKTCAIPTSLIGNRGSTTSPDLRVPSLLNDNEAGSLARNRSPTSMMSSTGAPHMIALYAHNALNYPASLDPQDILSPHVASLSIDDHERQPGAIVETTLPAHHQTEDLAVNFKFHCAHCREEISPGEVVVFADRAGPEVVWHPKCFVCNVCEELLVDMVYFFNKDRVYCGRHYAEILDIPRCSACDELIFVKEYTVAEGQAFHVKHFCCFECDDPLGGKQYVPKDGQPVCLPCYAQKYGKQCQTCHLVIGAKDQGVSWKDLHWHAVPLCFCCKFCQKSLLGGRFAVKDQMPFCSKECMQGGTSMDHQKVSAV